MDKATLHILPLTVGELATRCYVLWLDGRDDCLVIDPGAEAETIRRACENRRIAAILLTHGHFDHIGAARGLMAEDTVLAVHRLDAPLLSDPQANVSWMLGRSVTAPTPTRLLEEGDAVEIAGMTLQVLHTPGHTPGGVCYKLGEHLFTGDTMFDRGYGRTDLPGGDEAALIRSLRRLTPLRRTCRIFAGHEG